jgi:hypothetical protein
MIHPRTCRLLRSAHSLPLIRKPFLECEKWNETNKKEFEKIQKKLTDMQIMNISMYTITFSYYISCFFS